MGVGADGKIVTKDVNWCFLRYTHSRKEQVLPSKRKKFIKSTNWGTLRAKICFCRTRKRWQFLRFYIGRIFKNSCSHFCFSCFATKRLVKFTISKYLFYLQTAYNIIAVKLILERKDRDQTMNLFSYNDSFPQNCGKSSSLSDHWTDHA